MICIHLKTFILFRSENFKPLKLKSMNIYKLFINGARSLPGVHDDVIRWKHFPCYWPFVQGIHRSPGNSPHKEQWRRALMFFFYLNGWVNNCEAGDLGRCHANYGVTVVSCCLGWTHLGWNNMVNHLKTIFLIASLIKKLFEFQFIKITFCGSYQQNSIFV